MLRYFSRSDDPKSDDFCFLISPPEVGQVAPYPHPSVHHVNGNFFVSRESLSELPIVRQLFLGQADSGQAFWAVEVEPSWMGAEKIAFRQLMAEVDVETATAGAKAVQYLHWMKTHRYCGSCGEPTERRWNEFVLFCPSCSAEFYPRINPVVIMVVHRDNQVLLARHTRSKLPIFSCLAGYVESGETLEQAVRREVFEEVGVEIGEPTYFSSQFWPFPNSLMIGFFAPWKNGEPLPDGVEISEAGWFSKTNLPELPPGISIARRLLRGFFQDPTL